MNPSTNETQTSPSSLVGSQDALKKYQREELLIMLSSLPPEILELLTQIAVYLLEKDINKLEKIICRLPESCQGSFRKYIEKEKQKAWEVQA